MDTLENIASEHHSLEKSSLLRMYFRLLFIQGLLNRKGMQNFGFANALAASDTARKESEIVRRHFGFFNCNPNFTPLVVGGVLRLEEERLSGKPISERDIEYFKRTISSPLAAMGDMLFLGSIKPLALTFACIFAIYNSIIGLLAVFLLYNLLILSCRLWGIYFGYSRGWELVEVFSSPVFQRVLNIVQGIGASIGGALVAILIHRFIREGSWASLASGALAIVVIVLIRKDVSATWFAIFLFVISILLFLLLV
jgi:PTS system mannose-specific IID component